MDIIWIKNDNLLLSNLVWIYERLRPTYRYDIVTQRQSVCEGVEEESAEKWKSGLTWDTEFRTRIGVILSLKSQK